MTKLAIYYVRSTTDESTALGENNVILKSAKHISIELELEVVIFFLDLNII
jgi:hypothetical protein